MTLGAHVQHDHRLVDADGERASAERAQRARPEMGLDLDGRARVPVDGVDAGLGEGEAVEGLDGGGDGAGLGDVGAGDADLFFVRRG